MGVLAVQDRNVLSARRDLKHLLLKHHWHMVVAVIKMC